MNCIATCCYLFLQNAFHLIASLSCICLYAHFFLLHLLYLFMCTSFSYTFYIYLFMCTSFSYTFCIYLCALLSLTASDDFVAQTNVPVTFDPTSAWQTVDVQVVNDNILESTEYFVGVITSSSMQRRVLLGQSTMSVNLVDDDSELSLMDHIFLFCLCVDFASYKSSLTSTATFEAT